MMIVFIAAFFALYVFLIEILQAPGAVFVSSVGKAITESITESQSLFDTALSLWK